MTHSDRCKPTNRQKSRAALLGVALLLTPPVTAAQTAPPATPAEVEAHLVEVGTALERLSRELVLHRSAACQGYEARLDKLSSLNLALLNRTGVGPLMRAVMPGGAAISVFRLTAQRWCANSASDTDVTLLELGSRLANTEVHLGLALTELASR